MPRPFNRRGFLAAGTATLMFSQRMAMANTPAHRVPAEEDRHALTFMQMPVNLQVYGSRHFLRQAQQTIADIANTIAEFEPVVMLADARHHDAARQMLSGSVELWDIPTDDLWCRDSGPLFTRQADGSLAVSHIQFNGWGNKQIHRNDGRIAGRVAKHLGLPLIDSGLKGEPGGAEQDGHGLLIAHESSWVNENRNPGLTRDEVGERLMQAYGANRLVWAPGVWGMDITDFHIDALARFTAPGRVLMNLSDVPYPEDPYYRASLETHGILKDAGLSLDVIADPRKRRVQDEEFVASYVNYYVCNGAVIAAEFGDPETDQQAKQALRRLYPGREVVMLNVDLLGELGGGIHCATQQMPA